MHSKYLCQISKDFCECSVIVFVLEVKDLRQSLQMNLWIAPLNPFFTIFRDLQLGQAMSALMELKPLFCFGMLPFASNVTSSTLSFSESELMIFIACAMPVVKCRSPFSELHLYNIV